MYSRCLFCTSDLGRNEAIERFAVGKRLAYDAAKGRLWVVCPACERWNLTPLEERWEAIEEAERLYSGTKLRVATDNVGLARVREGTELVRIGAPMRPEFAAWRYGDQFGRRRRRAWAAGAAGAAVFGGVMVAGPVLGLIGGGAASMSFNLWNVATGVRRQRKIVARVAGDDGSPLRVTASDARLLALAHVPGDPRRLDDLEIQLSHRRPRGAGPWWQQVREQAYTRVRGARAADALSQLLPHLNQDGGSRSQVRTAVETIDRADSPLDVLRLAADRRRSLVPRLYEPRGPVLARAPRPILLALEMILHEDDERRALEGELRALEERWREAEEIAGIADRLLLPAGVEERVPAR